MSANMIDGYIEAHGLDAPAEVLEQLRNGYSQKIITELDLSRQGDQHDHLGDGIYLRLQHDKTTSI